MISTPAVLWPYSITPYALVWLVQLLQCVRPYSSRSSGISLPHVAHLAMSSPFDLLGVVDECFGAVTHVHYEPVMD